MYVEVNFNQEQVSRTFVEAVEAAEDDLGPNQQALVDKVVDAGRCEDVESLLLSYKEFRIYRSILREGAGD